MNPRRAIRSPFFWFLALLLCGEVVASIYAPYRHLPTASETARNPLPLRGWPEHLRPGDGVRAANVAIVSNSQGVGMEVADPQDLYPHHLEQAFKATGHDVNIENWSVSGLRSDQIELLSMVAAERAMDLLVIVTEIKSLDVTGSTRLGANSDDLDLVAGHARFWPAILSSRLLGETRWDELLHRFLAVNSGIVRLRHYALDLLAAILPLEDHVLVFGHRRSRYALDPVASRPVTPGSDLPREEGVSYITVPAGTWETQFRRNRVPTFDKLFPQLDERLRESGTKLVWTWMPIYPGASTADMRAGAEPVYRDLCTRMSRAGVRCLDLTDALPATAFVTASASSHLNRTGHRTMADLLLPTIDDALH